MARKGYVAVIAVTGFLFPSSALAVPGDFFQPSTAPEAAGDAPHGIVSEDFNGDDKADLAITNGEDSLNITVLLGDGTGDFTAAATSPEPVGSVGSWGLTAADVDNDDDEDLIGVGGGPVPSPGQVGIYLNNGSGDFAAPLIETAAGWPRVVVAAQMNNDTEIDLVVGNFYPATVTVLLNDGDDAGDFTAAGPAIDVGGTADNLSALAAAPIDNDSDTDIVVGHESSNDIHVINNTNNTGTFNVLAPQDFSGDPTDIAVGNFNGGFNDIAVSNGATSDVSILNGVGDGTFTAVAGSPVSIGALPASSTANALVAEDFTGDANLDLAVAIGFNTQASRTAILFGNGAGTFTTAPTSPEAFGNVSLGITAGQFNGGNLDLALSNLFPQPVSPVNILLNDGPGSTPPPGGGGGSSTGGGTITPTPVPTTPTRCKKGQKLVKGVCKKAKKKKKKKK